MATSSGIPGVIDALVTIIGGLDVITTYNVAVSDGFPVNQAENLVVVGGGRGNDASGTQQYAGIGYGAAPRNESFTVELFLTTFIGSGDQKTVRDMAFDIFDGIAAEIRSNSTLSGACTKCQVGSLSVSQTDAETSADGRQCDVTVSLNVDCYYLHP